MAQDPPTFADWITSTSNALGYSTSASLARALDIQQSTVSRWKSGKRPGVEHLAKLSELFQMELKPLLVLAGYLSPVSTPLSREELVPEQGVPEVDARILKANLSEEQRRAIQSFWMSRMEEEKKRLEEMLEFAELASHGGITDSVAADYWPMVLETKLASHVFQCSERLIEAAPWRQRPCYEHGKFDKRVGAFRKASLVGKRLPKVGTWTITRDPRWLWRFNLIDKAETIVGWGPGRETSNEALADAVEWMEKHADEFLLTEKEVETVENPEA